MLSHPLWRPSLTCTPPRPETPQEPSGHWGPVHGWDETLGRGRGMRLDTAPPRPVGTGEDLRAFLLRTCHGPRLLPAPAHCVMPVWKGHGSPPTPGPELGEGRAWRSTCRPGLTLTAVTPLLTARELWGVTKEQAGSAGVLLWFYLTWRGSGLAFQVRAWGAAASDPSPPPRPSLAQQPGAATGQVSAGPCLGIFFFPPR